MTLNINFFAIMQQKLMSGAFGVSSVDYLKSLKGTIKQGDYNNGFLSKLTDTNSNNSQYLMAKGAATLIPCTDENEITYHDTTPKSNNTVIYTSNSDTTDCIYISRSAGNYRNNGVIISSSVTNKTNSPFTVNSLMLITTLGSGANTVNTINANWSDDGSGNDNACMLGVIKLSQPVTLQPNESRIFSYAIKGLQYCIPNAKTNYLNDASSV